MGYYLRVSAVAPGPHDENGIEVLEHQFRALVECSEDAVFVTDFQSARFLHVNSKACQLFGYPMHELCGMTGRHLHAPEDYPVVDEISRELVQTGNVLREAVRLRRRDHSMFWAQLRSSVYHVQGSRTYYVAFVRDITDRLDQEPELSAATLKSIEAQLVRSSRLAAIGQVAAGVAHEVNNPAATALMNLNMVERDLTLARQLTEGSSDSRFALFGTLRLLLSDAQTAVRDSIEAVERIASVVRGLRRFAPVGEAGIRRIHIGDAVRGALRLVQRDLSKVATVRCELDSTRVIAADMEKLTQVFASLLSNAGHAIEQGGGGSIVVRTRDVDDGVVVSVEDDGPGVPPEIAGQIFEPFFTTRGADQSMGLGLPMCADIVQQHHGRIQLCARHGRGACFEVFLPQQTGLSVPAQEPHEPLVRGGRLLLIDDDDALIRAYRRSLGRKYEVVMAGTAESALQVLEQDDDFDAILCDLVMPGCGGVGLYEALSERNPSLLERLIFCSGGPTTRRCREFVARPGIVFFEKPIHHEALDACISRLIRKRASHASASLSC